ncbi:MAG: hypothetical protein JWQ00_216 [Noviherbaspirillum sp.]|nr:hypothetical protein [Noviherbaspirillum sp.]
MNPESQLEAIIKGRIPEAVRTWLGGDWSRVGTLFTIPRSAFNAWADSIELPYARVFKTYDSGDGVYVLPDADGWLVFRQANGIRLAGERTYATYREAKRAALAIELLSPLRGAI